MDQALKAMPDLEGKYLTFILDKVKGPGERLMQMVISQIPTKFFGS